MLLRYLPGLLALTTFLFSVNALGGDQKNVLLILVDDLKPAIGAYGDTFAVTPNIDRLAQRGVRFENAHANQAVCMASRYNLIHGYYASVSYMDAQLGRLIDAVDELGLAENTIIALWGDHAYHAYLKRTHLGQAIRDDRYRMVQWTNRDSGAKEYELYDYVEDPLETRNLAGERKAELDRLIAMLESHPEAKQQAPRGRRK